MWLGWVANGYWVATGEVVDGAGAVDKQFRIDGVAGLLSSSVPFHLVHIISEKLSTCAPSIYSFFKEFVYD